MIGQSMHASAESNATFKDSILECAFHQFLCDVSRQLESTPFNRVVSILKCDVVEFGVLGKIVVAAAIERPNADRENQIVARHRGSIVVPVVLVRPLVVEGRPAVPSPQAC